MRGRPYRPRVPRSTSRGLRTRRGPRSGEDALQVTARPVHAADRPRAPAGCDRPGPCWSLCSRKLVRRPLRAASGGRGPARKRRLRGQTELPARDLLPWKLGFHVGAAWARGRREREGGSRRRPREPAGGSASAGPSGAQPCGPVRKPGGARVRPCFPGTARRARGLGRGPQAPLRRPTERRTPDPPPPRWDGLCFSI